jgi:glutamine amidotransferase
MSQVAIVKYNAGNVRSVQFALARLGVEPLLTDDPAALRAASHVIFPGVGEASSAMRYLREHGLDDVIPSLTQPVLGICLGLQLMCRHSEEADTRCFGIFDTNVKRFQGDAKIPQIGWNTVHHDNSPLFADIPQDAHFYFVHSFYAEACSEQAASTEYILPFASAMNKGNFHAVQFHPEKSADVGSQLLRNFLTL